MSGITTCLSHRYNFYHQFTHENNLEHFMNSTELNSNPPNSCLPRTCNHIWKLGLYRYNQDESESDSHSIVSDSL